MIRRGFTLLELMVVIAIMGLMGSLSVSGYRALRRGMEERGVMQNVSSFMKAAWSRSQIDRQPVAVYFWNETRRLDDDSSGDTLAVVGRAVAVRRTGRLSNVTGQFLVDEYGDLATRAYRDDEGDEDRSDTSYQQDPGMYLYRVNGDESGFNRSLVSQTTVYRAEKGRKLGASDFWEMEAYAFYVLDKGGIDWKIGDAYALEFASLTLPNNYIFGSQYSTSLSSPVKGLSSVTRFDVNAGSANSTVTVYNIQPDSSGKLTPKRVDQSENPEN